MKKQADLAKATTAANRKKLKKELDEITAEILKRNVTVYGAINLRTDRPGGEGVLASFRHAG